MIALVLSKRHKLVFGMKGSTDLFESLQRHNVLCPTLAVGNLDCSWLTTGVSKKNLVFGSKVSNISTSVNGRISEGGKVMGERLDFLPSPGKRNLPLPGLKA